MTWRTQAACRGMSPAYWYAERGESIVEAKAICAGCPVQAECLAAALASRERHGIWGGYTEKERRMIRRLRPAPVVRHGTSSGYQRGCRCPACTNANCLAAVRYRAEHGPRPSTGPHKRKAS